MKTIALSRGTDIRTTAIVVAALVLFSSVSVSCAKAKAGPGSLDVAVFIPGVVSGSPIYELLVAGVERAVKETPNATMKVVEAGFNQAEWLEKLVAIVATGEFELVVSSNPSMPSLCATVAKDYPKARFFVADAYQPGDKSMHTVLYNQTEQGYIVGVLAALVTADRAGAGKRVAGIVAAQGYPTLDMLIVPGFLAGLKSVDPAFTLEMREIGNWYDANKAFELANSIFDSGAQVILPVAGGAGQGVLAAAAARKKGIVWFDGSGYALGPDTVLGCAILRQDKLAYERVKAILSGDASKYGKADVVDAASGYVDFDGNGDAYRALPAALRDRFEAVVADLRKGKPALSTAGITKR